MITPQFQLPLHGELVIDLFAGGGGASTGIEQAIGRAVDIAIDHDPEAVSLHQANHPQTMHYVSDVFEVDPLAVTSGRPVGLMWASPDCKHFSKAKGGKPVSKKIRSLAWVVIKWAKLVQPRVICLENVEEFQHWGPLNADTNMPCPLRKGRTFRAWKAQLQGLGYQVEHRELRACDCGAPTIRKRLFLVARRDGVAIDWPDATHGAPDSLPVKARKVLPWRTAAECIDWSIEAPSIFERTRPLADATCRRIAKGLVRYVIEAKEPFIVPLTHQGGDRVESISEPMRTVTSANRGEKALVVPTIISMGHGERAGQEPRVPGIEKPHSTITAQGQHSALVTAFLAKHYTGVIGSAMPDPMGTVTSVDHHSLVSATMVTIDNQSSAGGSSAAIEPLKTTTVENRHALVQAFLIKYYGSDQDPRLSDPLHTITTRDRFGLVTVHGQPYAIVDIGLRMLAPRELYRAQGFPDSYRIDQGADGRPLTKTAQVRMCAHRWPGPWWLRTMPTRRWRGALLEHGEYFMHCSLHNLLEQLDHGRLMFFPQLNAEAEWVDSLEQVLRRRGNEAIAFYIGDEKFLEGFKVIPDLVRLPYPLCWFEGQLSSGGESRSGLLCEETSDGIEIAVFARNRDRDSWCVMAGLRIKRLSDELFECRQMTGFSEFQEVFEQVVDRLGAFLSALNCVNVTREVTKVDKRLQDRRAKRGRRPIFDYWTLMLDLGRSGDRSADLGGSHRSPRVHLRRGHVRKYLPGKWCWVNAAVVGQKSSGIVHKEYAVAACEMSTGRGPC